MITSFDTDAELTKIANTRLNDVDYEQMTGNYFKANIVRLLSYTFIPDCVERIGHQEMLAALKFSPNHPYQSSNHTQPTEDELQSAFTPEAYFELKEQGDSWSRSMLGSQLSENNITTGIAFLDARFPAIRAIFKKAFEAKLPKNAVINKRTVDDMMKEYDDTRLRVREATDNLMTHRTKWDD
ncbi:unnamed protein product [Caenorhabditis nigoni]